MPESFVTIVGKSLVELGASVDDRFLIALSGGGDSTALALAMCELVNRDNLVAAHLDHNVRQGSGKDREQVQRFCEQQCITCITGVLEPDDVRNERRKCGSLEGALRNLRYRFLEQTMTAEGMEWIVTGHTWDDQAETVMVDNRKQEADIKIMNLAEKGDIVIIIGFGFATLDEAKTFKPTVVVLDEKNNIESGG